MALQTNQSAMLRHLLQQALQQNQELRQRLSKISQEADLSAVPPLASQVPSHVFPTNIASSSPMQTFRWIGRETLCLFLRVLARHFDEGLLGFSLV